jgi:outer membrane protein OmpA-like peptidoglycan-associated protein
VNNVSRVISFLVVCAVVLLAVSVQAQDDGIENRSYTSFGAGMIGFEGDEEVKDGYLFSARYGYDWQETWGLEAVFTLAPSLDVNYANANGTKVKRGDFDTTWGAGLALDGLYHFTRWRRVDPYLALGFGFIWYDDEINEQSLDPATRIGAGVMFHRNNQWAGRIDVRTFFAGNDTEANAIIDAGIVYTIGAGIPEDPRPEVGPDDADKDGLSDERERDIGTDPWNPDTDDDGLKDGEEVLTYNTDPLNPDTDWDGLKDGPEVNTHETDPLDRDTDDGGVADGHEVLDDSTNPLKGSDDLMLVELNIKFDYNKAVIKPEYFGQLNIIGKVLSRNADATAVVEGHADQKAKSGEDYNMKLSKRRAQSVVNYLESAAGIDKNRLKAVGYGFSRPKVKPDLVNGNPENRRVEVYIRGADKATLEGMGELDLMPENK